MEQMVFIIDFTWSNFQVGEWSKAKIDKKEATSFLDTFALLALSMFQPMEGQLKQTLSDIADLLHT